MAEVVKEETRDGRRVRIYSNGLERDASTGHIIKPADNTLITPESASDFHRARKEKKRAVLLQAVNGSVQRADYIERYGEFAWLAAVGESAFIKATTPDDPKAIEAARFLLSETGFSELSTEADDSGAGSAALPRIVLILAELARRRDDGGTDPGVIDGSVSG